MSAVLLQPREVGRCFSSLREAAKSTSEKLVYVVATYAGTGREKLDCRLSNCFPLLDGPL